jgi:hypothetical protein
VSGGPKEKIGGGNKEEDKINITRVHMKRDEMIQCAIAMNGLREALQFP